MIRAKPVSMIQTRERVKGAEGGPVLVLLDTTPIPTDFIRRKSVFLGSVRYKPKRSLETAFVTGSYLPIADLPLKDGNELLRCNTKVSERPTTDTRS